MTLLDQAARKHGCCYHPHITHVLRPVNKTSDASNSKCLNSTFLRGEKKPKQKTPNTFKTLGHWMCYSTLMTGGAGWRQRFHHLLPWEETIMLYWLMAAPCWSLQKRGHTGVETWSLIDGNIKAIDRRRWPFHDVNTQLLLLGTV